MIRTTQCLALALVLTSLSGGAFAQTNRGAALAWRGYVDLDLQFSDFFDQDHTIMARFMAQTTLGYAGPIIAENGSGTFFLGQANVKADDWGSKLMLIVGDARATYSNFHWLPPEVGQSSLKIGLIRVSRG